MATRTQKIKVGVFVTLSAAAAIAGIIITVGLYEDQGMRYWIEFNESVLGLNEGGMVEYLGVPVGKVDLIEVTSSNRAHVEIVINPEKVVLRQGVQAQLVIYSLAAGTMAISLSGGEPSAQPLPINSQIPMKPSTMEAVSSRIEDLMDNMNSIATTVEKGLADFEEGQITRIAEKVEVLLDDAQVFMADGNELIAKAGETLDGIGGESEAIIGNARDLSERLNSLAENADGLVSELRGKVNDIDVSETQRQLNEVLENVASLSGKVNAAAEKFESITESAMHDIDNVQYALESVVRDIGDALDSVYLFAEQLRENPSSLFRGRGKKKEPAE